MKIVEFVTRLNIGGPSFHAIAITKALKTKGWDTLLITGIAEKEEGSILEEAMKSDIRIKIIPELSSKLNPLKDIIAFIRLLLMLKVEMPDIIHSHTAKAGFLARVAGIFIRVLLRKKVYVIHTYHGFIFEKYFSKPISLLILLTERFLSKITSRIICVSPALKIQAMERYRISSDSKLTVIPYGIRFLESKQFASSGEAKSGFGVGDNTFIFAAIGRLVQIKDFGLFLDSANLLLKRMNQERHRVKFLIAGDGPEKPFVEKIADQLNLKNNLISPGWIKNMEYVYPAIDVLCITSKSEGVPFVCLEAMYASKPVLAVDVGGIRDVFTIQEEKPGYWICSEGILVKERNPVSISNAMLFLLQNPEMLKEMGYRAKKRIEDNFTEDRMIESFNQLFGEIMRGAL
ncbi:MAG TPA: glycosyltransferase [bacterium]